jgi:hypothetical protein
MATAQFHASRGHMFTVRFLSATVTDHPTFPTSASISAHAFSPIDCRQSR